MCSYLHWDLHLSSGFKVTAHLCSVNTLLKILFKSKLLHFCDIAVSKTSSSAATKRYPWMAILFKKMDNKVKLL